MLEAPTWPHLTPHQLTAPVYDMAAAQRNAQVRWESQHAARLLATLPALAELHCNPTALYHGAYAVNVSSPTMLAETSGQPSKRGATNPAAEAFDWLNTHSETPAYPALQAAAAKLLNMMLAENTERSDEPALLRHLFGSLTTLQLLSSFSPLPTTEHTKLRTNNLAIGLIAAAMTKPDEDRLRLLDCSAIRLTNTVGSGEITIVDTAFVWPTWLWLCAPTLEFAQKLKSTVPASRVLINHESLPNKNPPGTTPWLTIVIPCIDATDLDHTLASVWQQSHLAGTEVIVINATQQTLDLPALPPSKEHHGALRVIDVIDNGPYEAMNLGLLISESEWVYFLGVNDSLSDSVVLEDVRAKLSVVAHDCSMIYGNVRMIGAGPGSQDGEIYAGFFDYARLKHQNICHQGVFYRREALFNVGGFDLKYRVNSDWAANIRIWRSANPQYFGRTVANFSRGGLSSTIVDKMFFDDLEELWTRNAP